MTTDTMTANQTDVAAQVAPAPAVDAAKAEADAFFKRVFALATEGGEVSVNALEQLVDMLGRSTNVHGRPSTVAFLAYLLAMEGRNFTLPRRAELAQRANNKSRALKKDGTFAKPFKLRAQASGGEGNLSFKLNLPATFEAQV